MATNSINQGAAGGIIIQPTWGTIEGNGSPGKEDNFDAILNELRTYLDAKADKKDVYTKDETDDLLDGKSDTGHTHSYLPLTGGTLTGDLLFSTNGDTGTRQIRLVGGSNDYGRLAVGATAQNAGWMEIATADDGTEPIYVRQYTDAYSTVTRTLTLLDANGNTSIPKTVIAMGGMAMRPTDANRAATGSGGIYMFKASASMSSNKPPSGDGHIIGFEWDNTGGWDSQVSITNLNGEINVRGMNNGTWQAWRKVLDSGNYSSFTLPKTGGSLSGPIVSQPGDGVSYIEGCGGASTGIYVKKLNLNVDKWIPGITIQTKTGGGWSIGNYNNESLQFAYGTKANIDAHNNSCNVYAIDINGNFSGKAANVTGTVAIGNGGTGATTAAAARQNLFNENLASNGEYLIAITTSWAKGGYIAKSSVPSWLGVLPLSGGTLTGALNFANNTWNKMGDDCYIGDHGTEVSLLYLHLLLDLRLARVGI